MNLHAIQEQALVTRTSALSAVGTLPDGVSIDSFLAAASRVGDFDHYKVVTAEARNIVKQVSSSAGEVGVRAFLRAALAQGAINALGSAELRRLPPQIIADHTRELGRVVSDSDPHAEWLCLDNDLFQKEFGIVSFRLYAAGAQLVDPRCGVPRSHMLRGGLADVPRRVLIMLGLGGFRPFFQVHAHEFMLNLLNEQGREDCYRGCIALFDLFPKVRGIIAGSWFYDPAVTVISPRVAYFSKTPLQHGGHVMFVEEGGQAAVDAVATSPTRRRLQAEGKYVPKTYMLIWGKKQMIAWAARRSQAAVA